ncbi:hypothetical protein Ptr902_00693 [Pyrenophora tritici-repentis]|uniref:Uncharacterized protein n=2 Tax=Pyrenophora tritici-repentis TaxID=45151 RepID=A0A2W1GTD7_9PLEO|nr:hypothetical protein Alg130_06169 [Pyrenophora tritici-repentis]KAI1518180.1 hypothetical protein Ptr86124_003481 [Pyrenophora tritici-repentis]KAI1563808.1 hypothetical protein PtrEW4_009194 [Pyrenophora tritici-repentis]KAI1567509.1 hypothetical protein PtrEW7m1_009197 [Pyrenophora tritici-repentis]KAI1583056.1 hypothetical protein PtrEW13061_008975 [Pyrenophora tritici-repentis]
MAFTLVFPTFTSAMTGYNGNVEPFVNATDSNYVPFGSFYYALYVIHDGWRIDREGEHIVIDSYGGKDVRRYGLDGKVANPSVFMGQELPPPVVNISTFYLNYQLAKKSVTRKITYYEKSKDDMRWAYGNSTYKWEDLEQRGRCQAVLDYQWGFSFIQLFMMVIILIIWTIGILVMWRRSQSTVKRRARKEVAGENKAILELSYTMRRQLSEHTREEGEDDSTITESVLSDRIKKDLQGGSISYLTPLLPNGDSTEKWTFLN